jgi:hypothetical protein
MKLRPRPMAFSPALPGSGRTGDHRPANSRNPGTSSGRYAHDTLAPYIAFRFSEDHGRFDGIADREFDYSGADSRIRGSLYKKVISRPSPHNHRDYDRPHLR